MGISKLRSVVPKRSCFSHSCIPKPPSSPTHTQVDATGRRKVLATTAINMVKYASSMPYDHDLHLRLKPVSRKIKKVILEVSLSSLFLREGKAT